jgi:CheY-like chemotaxis protein
MLLPAVDPNAAAPSEASSFSPRPVNPTAAPRILLVEDEEQIAAMSSDVLGELGYRVTVAHNAERALERGRAERLLADARRDADTLRASLAEQEGAGARQSDTERAALARADECERDRKAIAAASLGQVHVATKDGKKLAVKVQRQGLKKLFDEDLKNIKVCHGGVETRYTVSRLASHVACTGALDTHCTSPPHYGPHQLLAVLFDKFDPKTDGASKDW